jgi:hypothetical protein
MSLSKGNLQILLGSVMRKHYEAGRTHTISELLSELIAVYPVIIWSMELFAERCESCKDHTGQPQTLRF